MLLEKCVQIFHAFSHFAPFLVFNVCKIMSKMLGFLAACIFEDERTLSWMLTESGVANNLFSELREEDDDL